MAWCSVSLILGITGNLLVIHGITGHRSLKIDKTSIVIILNLAISDLTTILIFTVPGVLCYLTGGWGLFQHPGINEVLCVFVSVSRLFLVSCNSLLVSLLSLNKFVRCQLPLQTLGIGTSIGWKVVTVVWVAALLPMVLVVVLKDTLTFYYEARLLSCTISGAEGLWVPIFGGYTLLYFYCPLFVLLLSNLGLILLVKLSRRQTLHNNNILVVVAVAGTFLLTLTPWLVSRRMRFGKDTESGIGIFEVIGHYIIVLSSWANPIIYIGTNKSFRRYVLQVLSFQGRGRPRVHHVICNVVFSRGLVREQTTSV